MLVKEKQSCVFYRSFFLSIEKMPIENQLPLYKAIIDYSLNFKQPHNLENMEEIVFDLVKPIIDANIKRYYNACLKSAKSEAEKINIKRQQALALGLEPIAEQTDTTDAPKSDQGITKTEATTDQGITKAKAPTDQGKTKSIPNEEEKEEEKGNENGKEEENAALPSKSLSLNFEKFNTKAIEYINKKQPYSQNTSEKEAQTQIWERICETLRNQKEEVSNKNILYFFCNLYDSLTGIDRENFSLQYMEKHFTRLVSKHAVQIQKSRRSKRR